jgi:hypothetical protein
MEIPATTTATLQPPTATSQSLTPIAETVTPTVEPTPTPEETLRIDIIQINQEVEELGWQAVEVIDDESMLVPNAAALKNRCGEVEWYVLTSEAGLVVYPDSDVQAVTKLETAQGGNWEGWLAEQREERERVDQNIVTRVTWQPYAESKITESFSQEKRSLYSSLDLTATLVLRDEVPSSEIPRLEFIEADLSTRMTTIIRIFKEMDKSPEWYNIGVGYVTRVFTMTIEQEMPDGSILTVETPAWEEISYSTSNPDSLETRLVFINAANMMISNGEECKRFVLDTSMIGQVIPTNPRRLLEGETFRYAFSGSADKLQRAPSYFQKLVVPGRVVLTSEATGLSNDQTHTNPNVSYPPEAFYSINESGVLEKHENRSIVHSTTIRAINAAREKIEVSSIIAVKTIVLPK